MKGCRVTEGCVRGSESQLEQPILIISKEKSELLFWSDLKPIPLIPSQEICTCQAAAKLAVHVLPRALFSNLFAACRYSRMSTFL